MLEVNGIDLYYGAAQALRKWQPDQALAQLVPALSLGEAVEQSYTQAVVGAVFAVLGDENPVTLKYRPQVTAVPPAAAEK